MPLDGVRYANSIGVGAGKPSVGAGNDNTVAAIMKHGWTEVVAGDTVYAPRFPLSRSFVNSDLDARRGQWKTIELERPV